MYKRYKHPSKTVLCTVSCNCFFFLQSSCQNQKRVRACKELPNLSSVLQVGHPKAPHLFTHTHIPSLFQSTCSCSIREGLFSIGSAWCPWYRTGAMTSEGGRRLKKRKHTLAYAAPSMHRASFDRPIFSCTNSRWPAQWKWLTQPW